jgi:hypothetical protein
MAVKRVSYKFVRMQLGALHVPNEWPLTDEFNSRVSRTGVSAYLRELVERDLSGASEQATIMHNKPNSAHNFPRAVVAQLDRAAVF